MSLSCTFLRSYSEIVVENCIYLGRHCWWPHWNFADIFSNRNQNPWAIVWRCLCNPVFNRFGSVGLWQTDKQTDGRTHDDSIYRASIASCGKNDMRLSWQFQDHTHLLINYGTFLVCQIWHDAKGSWTCCAKIWRVPSCSFAWHHNRTEP